MPVHKDASGGIGDAGDGLLSLSLEFNSIDYAPPKNKAVPVVPTIGAEKSKNVLNGSEMPQLPAVDLSKVPEQGTPLELVHLVHERNGWPCHSLFDRGSWALHLQHLETHNRKPGMRVIIAKAETHGPKTTPYTIYVMHIKTAYSVRGLSRRYSEFKDLDEALRALKRSAPTLPRKKTWGKMSPKFITERKRQLQAYIEAILSDPSCANSEPFHNFLGTRGHPIEQDILERYCSSGHVALVPDGTALLTPWRLATGTRVEAIEALVLRCRAVHDVRQEARALNQLAIMQSHNAQRVPALNAMRQAFLCCRQLDDADGLLSCALSWASIHARFGEYTVAEQRLHEAEGMAAELRAVSGQASCHLLLALVKAAQGMLAAAAKEAVLAAELYNNAADTGHSALAQFTLGSLLLRCGEVRQAVEVLESSLLLRRRARDTLGLGESLCLLGEAFAQIGYQLHAMDYFDQALALCQEMGNRRGESICLRHLGRVHHLHGDHHEALASLDKSLTMCLRRDDAEGQALSHEHMAAVLLDLGDARQAIEHLQEAVALYTRQQAEAAADKYAAAAMVDALQQRSDTHALLPGGAAEEEGGGGVEAASAGRRMDEGAEAAAASTAGKEVEARGKEADMSNVKRVQEKLKEAQALIKQASGRGAVGSGEGVVRDLLEVPDVKPPRHKPLIDAILGKQEEGIGGGLEEQVVQLPSGNEAPRNKSTGPKFPLKFKIAAPGHDKAWPGTFKFLQSWSLHNKYYQTDADAADAPSVGLR